MNELDDVLSVKFVEDYPARLYGEKVRAFLKNYIKVSTQENREADAQFWHQFHLL